MIEIDYYTTPEGNTPFTEWLQKLDPQARYRVTIALGRLLEGNTGNRKPVGDDVFERKFTWRGGIRVYSGREGDKRVILLHSGTKHRQSDDIAKA